MTTPLEPDVAAFLAHAHPAVMASNRPDGQPVSVATWYLLDGDRILLNMDAGRARLRYLREDPRVSLTVLEDGNWYTHVSVRGSIVEWRDDEGLADIDRLSRHYGGEAYPNRERPRVSGWMSLEDVHTWGSRFR